MKNIILTMMLCSCTLMHAQQSGTSPVPEGAKKLAIPKNGFEFRAAWGTGQQLKIVWAGLDYILTSLNSKTGQQLQYQLAYRRFVTPKLAIKPAVTVQRTRQTLTQGSQHEIVFDEKWKIFGVSNDVEWYWQRKSDYAVYSGLGLAWGSAYHDGPDFVGNHKVYPYEGSRVGFQITPVGFQFGEKMTFHLDFGFGWNGIVGLGLGQKF